MLSRPWVLRGEEVDGLCANPGVVEVLTRPIMTGTGWLIRAYAVYGELGIMMR